MSGGGKRIDDIEVLRGIAVILVIIQHWNGNLITESALGQQSILFYWSGWVGVDLFLAISGFVIARGLVPPLQAAMSTGRVRRVMFGFWIRRAWRLLPSAWLWLAIILLLVVYFNQSGVFGSLQANLQATWAAMLNYANIRFALNFMVSEVGTSFVYWSLSLEEQFYLLFPFVVVLFRQNLKLVLWLFILGQWLLQAYAPSPMLFVFRLDAIALGVLIALYQAEPTKSHFAQRSLSATQSLRCDGSLISVLKQSCMGPVVLILGVVAMGVAGSPWADLRMRVAVIALIAAGLVWIASYGRGWLMPASRIKRTLIWIGARSYAAYLIHIPVFFFMREIWFRLTGESLFDGDMALPSTLIALLLIAVLSQLNYRFVEQPLRRRGAEISERMLASSSR